MFGNKLRKLRYKLLQRLFDFTLGRLESRRTYSPDIRIVGDSLQLVKRVLERELERHSGEKSPLLLDVGGRKRERAWLAEGYDYRAMDIIPQDEHVIVGDICHCPEIADDTFDVVMSFDVFEHVQRPWDAAEECVRILKPGGLMIHRTLFAWRYHPHPIDYWRYSAEGLEYLFSRTGRMETLEKGYDLKIRRLDKRGEMADLRDKPPLDYLGGFRENWRTLYIGRKKEA